MVALWFEARILSWQPGFDSSLGKTAEKMITIVHLLWAKLVGSDGSGSKNFDLGWVNFLLLGSGRVSHLWLGFGNKFTLKPPNFLIISLQVKIYLFGYGQKSIRVKDRLAYYLMRVKSMLRSGQVSSEPIPTLKAYYKN